MTALPLPSKIQSGTGFTIPGAVAPGNFYGNRVQERGIGDIICLIRTMERKRRNNP